MKHVLSAVVLFMLIVATLGGCTAKTNEIIKETERESVNIVNMEFESHIRNSAEMQYIYFEDLLGKVTDLLEGVFVSLTEVNGVYYYEFNVVKNLRENSLKDKIIVQSVPTDYTITGTDIAFSTYDVNYEKGKSYLLLLSRHSSVYTNGDVFSFVNDSLIIPLNTLSTSFSTTEKMLLYGKELVDQLKNQDTALAISQGTLKDFILEQIQSNPLSNEDEYIISTDINDILAASEYVFVVKIEELFMESYTKDRITYSCSVEEVLKGALSKEYIRITFPIDEVEIGNSYIVAVDELQGTEASYFVMSSKNSVYALSRYEQIRSILN